MNDIRYAMKIVSLFENHELFVTVYRNLLKQRLQSWTTNTKLESDIIKMLYSDKNNSTLNININRLMYALLDINNSVRLLDKYCNMKLKLRSEMYSLNDVANIDRNIFKTLVFRDKLFDDVDEKTYNFPKSIKIYLDTYIGLYNTLHSLHKLIWNYQDSIGIVEIPLNKNTYTIEMTFLQICVIMLFNDKPQWTAIEMVNVLNMTENELGVILNSFLKAGILTRTSGEHNDLNIVFSYNHDFSYDKSNKVSIVKCLRTSHQDSNVISPILVKEVLDIVKHKSNISLSDIYQSIKNKLSSPITLTQLESIIDFVLEKQYIVKINDMYVNNNDVELSVV